MAEVLDFKQKIVVSDKERKDLEKIFDYIKINIDTFLNRDNQENICKKTENDNNQLLWDIFNTFYCLNMHGCGFDNQNLDTYLNDIKGINAIDYVKAKNGKESAIEKIKTILIYTFLSRKLGKRFLRLDTKIKYAITESLAIANFDVSEYLIYANYFINPCVVASIQMSAKPTNYTDYYLELFSLDLVSANMYQDIINLVMTKKYLGEKNVKLFGFVTNLDEVYLILKKEMNRLSCFSAFSYDDGDYLKLDFLKAVQHYDSLDAQKILTKVREIDEKKCSVEDKIMEILNMVDGFKNKSSKHRVLAVDFNKKI
jgi:hypothetical protein